MRKAISHQSSVIRFLIVLSLTTYYILHTTPVLATDSTASARLDASIESQRASPSASLQTKLKQLQAEIASKASELKAEVSGRLQNKAYVGKIKSKSEESLILIVRNEDKTVKVNEFTEAKPAFKNLKAEDYVVALGDVDESDILTAKKIIKTTPPQDIKKVYFGEVLAVNQNMITLKTDKNLAISTNNQTDFKIGKEDGDLSDIKIGQKVVVSGIDKNDIIKASLVYAFPPSPI
ncbi:MAG: DUF5666 domain-containing protein [Candidatus Daviesbacteria bacterium]|nr:DUF5666 domain-containing protein [Candidatus Daviesbacteria bacterium]